MTTPRPVFLAPTEADREAMRGIGLDSELLADTEALHPGDWAIVLAHMDTIFEAGRVASDLPGYLAGVAVGEWPGGAKSAAEAVESGADAQAFLTEAGRSAKTAAMLAGADPEPIDTYIPFPIGVLPEPVRGLVTEGARSIGCDASFLALPLLSALAAAIGTTHRIGLKRTWTEPAILWTATVGESGAQKSPALDAAKESTEAAERKSYKEHAKQLAAWEADHLRYEAELAVWKRDAGKSKPGDGYTLAPPEKPAKPTARRYTTSDTTTEALAQIQLDNPRGVLLQRDELSGWLASFDRYASGGRGGADSAHWLSMHGGRSMTVDRKTGTPPTIYVPSASVSITGSIQPAILARAMGREHHESGLLARLFFAMPPKRAKRWTEAEISERTEAAVDAVFARLFNLTPDTDAEGDERPRVLRLDDDAMRAWVRFYDEHAAEQAELTGDLSAAWSKLEGGAARLALVVHLTRWAAGDGKAPPGPVDAESIAAGFVLARWFGNEAKRVYAVLSESDDDREARRLVELIRRKGGSVSGRELAQASRAYPTVAHAEAALSVLADSGAGRWENPEQTGGGRPKARRLVLSPVYGAPVYKTPPGVGGSGCFVCVDNVDARTNGHPGGVA